ncbi:HNH endonuclease signature motif containing protein [Mycolicibacterium arenosum]|uniref:HNH endonuclease n=1 Tax=Mycolicibacterium arenosum TaxID=2952157 RepID=A0ABT1M2W6_9MYCO|nr:HNH endonuclease signature motif containing protein [Mycolicibacterium sp. CAU 1645]MCP9273511.1 HNH endonuclease [Mycolicibacterium sp. CAU 1645]
MSGTAVPEAVEAVLALTAAYDRFAAADIACLSQAELLQVSDEYEALTRRMPAQSHRILVALQAVTTAVAMGAKNWKQVLATRWRISTAEAHRRLAAARQLGPRRATTGEELQPELPAVAGAQEHGAITVEHIAIIRDVVGKVRARFDALTAAQMEVSLVRLAIGVGPVELQAEAARRLFVLDQDGPEPDDRERDRQRGVTVGRQRRNGTTPITVEATPELAASLEAFYAKFAAPGMCNPDDPEPCCAGTPSQAQIDNDHRTVAQRRHDALVLMARIALMTDLGTLNGLPVSVIVKTTLQELQARAGVAVSGGGTTMSIADLIRMGAHAHWSLAVFDGATGSALDLFRTKRIATAAQRLMLIARDWGCTKPGCPVGPYGCQVHHAARDWGAGGNTNVDENALACPADNRLVGPQPHQWSTDVVEGVVHWHPPDHLDTGQATVNYRNRPDQIPLPDENAPLPWQTPPASPPTRPPTPPPTADPPTALRDEDVPPEPEPVDPAWAFGNGNEADGDATAAPAPADALDDPDALDAFAVWAFGDDTTPAPFIRFHAGTLQSFTATTRTRTELSRLIHRCRTRDPQGARGPAPPR